MKVLLIEDDKRIYDFIVKGLNENGFYVSLATNGSDARSQILHYDWDIILLDIMLPDIDGIQLTTLIRHKKIFTPILILSALSETEDKIKAIDCGADDYMTKPFHFQELISRINALVRRDRQYNNHKNKEYTCNDLVLNLENQTAIRGDKIAELTNKEYLLLKYLLEHKNKVVSRTQLLQAIWGLHQNSYTNIVDVYVSYIRNKINDTEENRLIYTIKGRGYIIKE